MARTAAKRTGSVAAGMGKTGFEKKDMAADRKAGVKEGGRADERMDKAAMKAKPKAKR